MKYVAYVSGYQRPNTLLRFESFDRMCDTVRVVLFWSGVTCGRILVSHVLYIACVGITLLFIMPTFNIMSLIRAVFFNFKYKPSSIARVYRDIYQIRFSNGSWHLHLGLHTVVYIGFFWNEWYFSKWLHGVKWSPKFALTDNLTRDVHDSWVHCSETIWLLCLWIFLNVHMQRIAYRLFYTTFRSVNE